VVSSLRLELTVWFLKGNDVTWDIGMQVSLPASVRPDELKAERASLPGSL
jgi:hypothetical protein